MGQGRFPLGLKTHAARRNPSEDDPNLQPLINASVNAFFRLNPQAQLAVVVLLLIAGVIAAIFYLMDRLFRRWFAALNLIWLLGNPSNATSDSSNRDNYLMVKPHYVLSYNDSKGTPNWVSWCVTESDLGEAPRKDEFDEDAELPGEFLHITSQDYSRSGFDRGHMCPHSDRAANQEMSFSTFIMTNIIPQAPNVNRKGWAQMEDYCRGLVRNHGRLYIIAGPIGQGGRGSEGERRTLADGRITVPSACWKVVVDLPDQGSDDVNRIPIDARVLTVEMPNDNDVVGEEWGQYRTTAARVEQQTGLHFFSALKPEVAQAFRQRLDRMPLPAPKPLFHDAKD